MRALLAILCLPLLACGNEITLKTVCVDDYGAFDIEEHSVLEDAQGYPFMRDAIVLDFDDSELGPNDSWRPKTIDMLAMIGISRWQGFPDNYQAVVEVWDGDDPTASDPYTVAQTIVRDELEWEDVTLANPATAEPNQKRAWWSFDFSDVIPETGMASSSYLVGVRWGPSGRPTVGYSNFNRSCTRNWTDYDDGRGWVLNSEGNLDPGQPVDSCSWPMFRVEVETRREQDECEERSSQAQ